MRDISLYSSFFYPASTMENMIPIMESKTMTLPTILFIIHNPLRLKLFLNFPTRVVIRNHQVSAPTAMLMSPTIIVSIALPPSEEKKLKRAKSAINRNIINGLDRVRKNAVIVSCEKVVTFSWGFLKLLEGLDR